MSTYTLNKMIRDINSKPDRREAYFADAESFSNGYELTSDERQAFLDYDIHALYQMGVHGLILRPFTIINKMPEPEYLKTIRDKNDNCLRSSRKPCARHYSVAGCGRQETIQECRKRV